MLVGMWIQKLKIQAFRNLQAGQLHLPGPGAYALYGRNGAGKTNVLEALSLLSPGRGLHRAKFDAMCPNGDNPWGLFWEVHGLNDMHQVGMQYQKGRKQARLDGEDLQNQTHLARLGAIIWFTPEMDRLFFDGPAPRRRFLDRMVFGHMPAHAGVLSRYSHHIQARAKLLKDNADADWIALEEKQAAHYGVKVQAARQEFMHLLNQTMPLVDVHMDGSCEKLLTDLPAEDREAAFTTQLEKNRRRDAKFQSTHFGPHRSDVAGVYQNMPLNQTSMGQHKRALLDIILAHATLLKDQHGTAPCLLLDEIAAHLDHDARKKLYDHLLPLGAQLWMTGTEKAAFDDLARVGFVRVDDGVLTPEFG